MNGAGARSADSEACVSEIDSSADENVGEPRANSQKNVVVLVVVPLSQLMVTSQFLNSGTAGTTLRSNVEFACRAKLRVNPLSAVYVHCDVTPLRSVMPTLKPATLRIRMRRGYRVFP